jgi:hypothetical protein
LFREFVVGQQARRDQHDRDISLAWHMAALERQKKLPALKSLLGRGGDRRQTVAEQRNVLHMLSEQYNIPLRKGKPGA